MLIADFPHGKAEYKKASKFRDGRFLVVKTSQEVYGVSRPTYENKQEATLALPDTWDLNPEDTRGKPHFITMTQAFCHWLFRWNVEKWLRTRFQSEQAYKSWFDAQPKDSYLIRSWKSLMKGDRAFTNRYGSDTNHDYISTNKIDDKEDMRLFNLVTGRAVFKIIKERTDKFGIECINFSQGFSQFNPYDHPQYFYEPIQTGRKLIGYNNQGAIWDERYIMPFPQFEPTRPIMPVILPFDSVAYISKSEVRELSPYEPNPPLYVL